MYIYSCMMENDEGEYSVVIKSDISINIGDEAEGYTTNENGNKIKISGSVSDIFEEIIV